MSRCEAVRWNPPFSLNLLPRGLSVVSVQPNPMCCQWEDFVSLFYRLHLIRLPFNLSADPNRIPHVDDSQIYISTLTSDLLRHVIWTHSIVSKSPFSNLNTSSFFYSRTSPATSIPQLSKEITTIPISQTSREIWGLFYDTHHLTEYQILLIWFCKMFSIPFFPFLPFLNSI